MWHGLHVAWHAMGHNEPMPVLVDHEKTRDAIAELACGGSAHEGDLVHSAQLRNAEVGKHESAAIAADNCPLPPSTRNTSGRLAPSRTRRENRRETTSWMLLKSSMPLTPLIR